MSARFVGERLRRVEGGANLRRVDSEQANAATAGNIDGVAVEDETDSQVFRGPERECAE